MLVAFSHLRWDFVWQRPQHLLSRFARSMPVVVVEEPEYGAGRDDVRVRDAGNVTVLTPTLAGTAEQWGFGPQCNSRIARLLEAFVAFQSPRFLWYYTPMAFGAEPAAADPELVIYDAMDDLASFSAAPTGMQRAEQRLLAEADIVFTGGPTLYRQRSHRHPVVYCFPSGVETGHFRQARNGIVRPAELLTRPRPILGYYGVIDERLDLDLVADLADLRPEWTITLVGPVAKIDEAAIPARPNIIRYGQQAYRDLPSFLACFDIAMMPFALNDATRAISPTKTLEYLAGGKPVISTRVADVVDLYGEVVSFADDAAGFAAAAETLLTRSPAAQRRWQAHADRVVAGHEWDVIAAEMLAVMDRARTRVLTPAFGSSAVLTA